MELIRTGSPLNSYGLRVRLYVWITFVLINMLVNMLSIHGFYRESRRFNISGLYCYSREVGRI